ncbi:MAG: signal peptidase I [Pseudohongiellaceae bacterium]
MVTRKIPFDLKVSENLEAIAISIAMALVLKFFVIEAYQIPTGSMQPTILGDQEAGIKDRIFADKLVTMLRPPRRWEVMIFRFPLDERRLYVKRIVGLPGETLTVQGGDIWIDGAVAIKPDSVNESVLKTVFPASSGGIDIGRAFHSTGEQLVDIYADRAEFPSGQSGTMLLRRDVLDRYFDGYDSDWGIKASISAQNAVPDLDLALTAMLEPGTQSLELRFVSESMTTAFLLPADGSTESARVELTANNGEPLRTIYTDGQRTLPAGGEVEIVARSVDRRIVLWVDGEEWLRFDDPEAPEHPNRPARSKVEVTLDGGGTVSDVVLRRDIFYLPNTARSGSSMAQWQIPEDSYFGMGDNTQNSYDSRSWQTITYNLTDGSDVTGFDLEVTAGFGRPIPPDANPKHLRNGSVLFADVHGDEYTLAKKDIAGRTEQPAPFIHERYLLGKAIMVFWPIYDPFRWKLIQ